MITKAKALEIANEWYSVNTWGDPGVCLYAFASTGRVQSEEHRANCLAYVRTCLADGCAAQDNPAKCRRELRALLSYLRGVAVTVPRNPDSFHAEPWLNAMVRGYIAAMLFATNDESTPEGGEPMDANYGPEDVAPDALAKIVRDCERFNGEHGPRMADLSLDPDRCGMCLFYDQAGHGVGFQDEEGDRESLRVLHDAARDMGDPSPYVGTAGLIYR